MQMTGRGWGLAALVVGVWLAYGPALGGEFLWDDQDWIVQNPALRSWEGLLSIWTRPGAVIQYYPLTYTSWWVDVHLWGLDPLPFHLENVLLHALNGGLVWAILSRLGIPGAGLAAFVFVLHPVHTESVAWIVERKNVLSGCLFLSSTLAWLSFDHSGRRRFWAASIGLFALALLAKTATVMLPAGLLLLGLWRHRSWARARAWALLPFFTLSILAAAMTIHMERGEGAVGFDWDLSLAQRFSLAGRVVWFYLAKLAWPTQLAFVYPRWSVNAGSAAAWLPILGLALLAALLWRQRAGCSAAIALGLGWFVTQLFPVLGFFDLYFQRYAYVADHFQYLPSLGPIALAAAAVTLLTRKLPPQVTMAVGATLVLLLGTLTWRQAHMYRDLESLWRTTLAKNPDAWMPHTNLGNLLFERGDTLESIAHHRRALEIEPRAFESLNAVGNHSAREGRFDQARELFDVALAVRPDDALTFNNLGAMETMRGDHRAAIDWFRRGQRKNSERIDLMANLASLLASASPVELREPQGAVELAERVCADPANRSASNLYILFNAYVSAGRLDDALQAGREAVRSALADGDTALAERIESRLRAVRSAR